jgi:hypothetical protein
MAAPRSLLAAPRAAPAAAAARRPRRASPPPLLARAIGSDSDAAASFACDAASPQAEIYNQIACMPVEAGMKRLCDLMACYDVKMVPQVCGVNGSSHTRRVC